jgi:hypothetical protein
VKNDPVWAVSPVEPLEVRANIDPGIYPDIPNDAYHAGPGISKSGLWTIYNQTPAHYRFPPAKKELTTQQIADRDFGSAAHVAILEPERFESGVFKGPKDRTGNKWKDAVAEAANLGRILVVQEAYERILAMRDTLHANARISKILTGGKPQVEASGYWLDPVTGELCRCRPDHYRPDLELITDYKTAESVHPDAFARAVENYGYHVQEDHYTEGWRQCGNKVSGFAFLAQEKKSPYAFKMYEIPPSFAAEGSAIKRKALDTYHECVKANSWPGYGDEVEELKFKRWSYRETPAPQFEEAA